MKKHERIKAALNFEEVDRVPINLWMHFSDKDINPKSLAECQVEHARKFDFDFIKLMPFGLYCVEDWGAQVKYYSERDRPPILSKPGIEQAEDWKKLQVLPAIYGTYGKQLQLAQYVSEQVKDEIPFVQTIFSPLTVALKLAGDRLLLDMKEHPNWIKQALEVITETTINFVKANIDAGVDGFFFSSQCSSYDLLSKEEYETFGVPYDLEVIESFKDETFFNIAHIHGENIMFDVIEKYPVNCLNWHDHWVSPSLKEARAKTDKCLLGGIREAPFYNENKEIVKNSPLLEGTVTEIGEHVKEAIDAAGEKGLILGPGCVVDPLTPERNLFAARRAVYIDSPSMT